MDGSTVVPDGLTEAQLLAILEDPTTAPPTDDPVSPQILALFFEETSGRFSEMHSALQKKDAVTFARAAHSVKSTSLYIHARDLSEVAAQLEKSADTGQLSDVNEPLARAEKIFAALRARHLNPDSQPPLSAT